MRFLLRLVLASVVVVGSVAFGHHGIRVEDFLCLSPALLVLLAPAAAALLPEPAAALRALYRGEDAAAPDRRHLAAAGRRFARYSVATGVVVGVVGLVAARNTLLGWGPEKAGEWLAVGVLALVYAAVGYVLGTALQAMASDALAPAPRPSAPRSQAGLAIAALLLLGFTPEAPTAALCFLGIALAPVVLTGWTRATVHVWGAGAVLAAVVLVTMAEIDGFKSLHAWETFGFRTWRAVVTAGLSALAVTATTWLGPRVNGWRIAHEPMKRP